jgi:voltage-gated potassium channel
MSEIIALGSPIEVRIHNAMALLPMNRLLHNKYLILLLALLLLLVVYPLLIGTIGARILFDALLALVFVATFLILFAHRHGRLFALIFGTSALIGLWSGYALPRLPPLQIALGFHLSATVFLGFSVATILWDISRKEQVSRDSIFGAFGGYVLVGLTFGHLYCFLETVEPGSFVGRGLIPLRLPSGDRLLYLLDYFSLVTLTTVGFGDVVPASDAVRGLSAVEGIVGQFYIAVLIAELIGRKLSRRVADN